MIGLTQAEIARRVGVSRQAVGFALGNYQNSRIKLRAETKRRILQTAHDTGYRPHRHAQALRKGRSGLIGMVQFGAYLQISVERSIAAGRAIHDTGYRLLSSDAAWHSDGFRTACDAILDERVEGVLLLNPPGLHVGGELERLHKAGIPIVAISGARLPNVPQVRSDVRPGMFELTRHLVQFGYRKLALLVALGVGQRDESWDWPTLERVAGFRDAALQAGLNDAEAEVVNQETDDDPSVPYEMGRLAMEGILKRAVRPRAVLCHNDDWAIGALTACGKAGVRVPEDIAVTGFDNSVVGRFGMVPLTTVSQQPQVMAQKAVDILMRMIRGESIRPEDNLVRLPCQLVVRQSCGSLLRTRS